MRSLAEPKDFEEWRILCRRLLTAEVRPSEILWHSTVQTSLFAADNKRGTIVENNKLLRVPKKFIDLARVVSCHRNAEKWDLLYRVLWRLAHNEPLLLKVYTDPEVCRLRDFFRAVSREAHRMKGFVRFKELVVDSQPQLIAWYKPDHFVLRLICPFFVRRFGAKEWAILTPNQCVYWDKKKLLFGPGVSQSLSPQTDDIENLWCTYYSSTFNPDRANSKLLKSNLPKRHWETLPESRLISPLLKHSN